MSSNGKTATQQVENTVVSNLDIQVWTEPGINAIDEFVPTVVPTQIVDDTFMLTLRDRQIRSSVDSLTSEVISSIENSGVLNHNPDAVSLAVTMKKAEKLFSKSMIEYTGSQLVKLGILKPNQVKGFEAWQASEKIRVSNEKLAKKLEKEKQPKPTLTAEEQVLKEQKQKDKKLEKLANARSLAEQMRKAKK